MHFGAIDRKRRDESPTRINGREDSLMRYRTAMRKGSVAQQSRVHSCTSRRRAHYLSECDRAPNAHGVGIVGRKDADSFTN
jgi:hypothetical protein